MILILAICGIFQIRFVSLCIYDCSSKLTHVDSNLDYITPQSLEMGIGLGKPAHLIFEFHQH